MNESYFSQQIFNHFKLFRIISLERAPELGLPDLLLLSLRFPPMAVHLELKVNQSYRQPVKWMPAQPRYIQDLSKLGGIVGTLVLSLEEGNLVWIKPEATLEAHRKRTPLGRLLEAKEGGARVLASYAREEWPRPVEGYLERLLEERLRLLKSN